MWYLFTFAPDGGEVEVSADSREEAERKAVQYRKEQMQGHGTFRLVQVRESYYGPSISEDYHG